MAHKKAKAYSSTTQKQAYKAQKKRERRSLKITDAKAPKKRKKRIRNRDEAEKQVPRTIESMRRFDETVVAASDAEVAAEENIDEFASYFRGERPPKLYLTTSRKPSEKMRTFIKELLLIIPNIYYFPRDEYDLDYLVKHATSSGFSAMLLITQGPNKLPNGLYICSLPRGPTTFFRLTSLVLASDMKGAGAFTESHSEIILNHFDTRVGRRIGRQIASLFPLDPDLEARRVITFHNQRDMIFFRHHRYVFRNEKKCSLMEIGPRFTLKMHSIQEGTMDLEKGLYEFIWRPDLQVDRKRFFI
ncbi:U3 small nucleolar ribonucleoprotein IMP4 [Babesia gibsoni]|uniref:U3 small nucleolar ribonucleoprotein IMP4 n=1 Tax=Babesia gibsoni TaxID=33632 RepID=A0AAD8LIP7_BABGI|nr:U3 small nucleolar ribonucleoprotein IMP4 [Babesia gibsoni]